MEPQESHLVPRGITFGLMGNIPMPVPLPHSFGVSDLGHVKETSTFGAEV